MTRTNGPRNDRWRQPEWPASMKQRGRCTTGGGGWRKLPRGSKRFHRNRWPDPAASGRGGAEGFAATGGRPCVGRPRQSRGRRATGGSVWGERPRRGRASRACWRASCAVKYICEARPPSRLITVITVLKLSLPCRPRAPLLSRPRARPTALLPGPAPEPGLRALLCFDRERPRLSELLEPEIPMQAKVNTLPQAARQG